MLDRGQLRDYIIIPALEAVDLGGDAAVQLILGTADIETRLCYIKQINGSALSLWQIEPATYLDITSRMLSKYPKLTKKALDYLGRSTFPNVEMLMGDLYLGVIIARFKYYLDPSPLPQANDYKVMAAYWKRIYNTNKGAGNVEKAEQIFRAAVTGVEYHY